ncbi:proteasome ATPase [Propioniciclava sp. MC1595]|uniref:proteasome ATPase n=1 Tax=Propioniciclava sp. MC1595 TaxID=2760308 RepID=UPI0016627E2E|nr:proteasome ATPase [Propioniciclava sp. MC1595]MBB1495907.1 proteasome ATPase [Propioniciclava sp. MC1595]QTE24623.1 proteasome ATPase [Propioniciclava sp. MC1595]
MTDEVALRAEVAERRLAQARADARALAQHNDKLNVTLREARDQLLALREQVAALALPPQQFGIVVGLPEAGLADVHVGGRLVRAAVAPEVVAVERLGVGAGVLVNEALVVVAVTDHRPAGEVVRVRERLDATSALVAGANDEEVVVQLGAALRDAEITPGESLLADRRALVAWASVARTDVEELTLEEVPDVSWADIGGLDDQIAQVRDAVELPFRHRDLFTEFGLAAPKGVLLYGPPGCGKTMVAKAVANSAGSSFLNIKGPELLNKYVGETERQIRLTFARAREVAEAGRPVIVFFDEMDSLFRTRGSGVSSDVESTIVPQLLAEIDGVESLANVIVIGATNREDLIDPAILRPGRLDVKIRLDRPSRDGAAEILGLSLTDATPWNGAEAASAGGVAALRASVIADAVADLYAETPRNEFVEVTYASGDREVLHVGDFASGAMLANIASRAKKAAIKELLDGGERGVRRGHVLDAVRAEVEQNEDLPNTTNPDDWAKLSGRRGERIVFMRTLAGGTRGGGVRALDARAGS